MPNFSWQKHQASNSSSSKERMTLKGFTGESSVMRNDNILSPIKLYGPASRLTTVDGSSRSGNCTPFIPFLSFTLPSLLGSLKLLRLDSLQTSRLPWPTEKKATPRKSLIASQTCWCKNFALVQIGGEKKMLFWWPRISFRFDLRASS